MRNKLIYFKGSVQVQINYFKNKIITKINKITFILFISIENR